MMNPKRMQRRKILRCRRKYGLRRLYRKIRIS